MHEHRRRVQIVLQDPYSSLNPRMQVRDIIAEPLTLGYPRRGKSPEVRDRVAELLQLVGLTPAKADFYPHQLSGGQRQRVAIARALGPSPETVILDEPTSALDVSVRAQILNLLKDIQDSLGVTYLVISHDLISVSYLASRVAVMYQGRVVEVGPTREVYASPSHPYSMVLLESAPSAGRIAAPDLERHPGPDPAATTAACRYAPRCGLRQVLGDPASCVEEDPRLCPVVGSGDGATRSNHTAACHFSERASRLTTERAAPEPTA